MLWHFEQTSAPSSVSQSWGLLANKSEDTNCLAGVGVGSFSVHARQNFCTLSILELQLALVKNIISEYFSVKIIIAAAFLFQELLLVT